MSNVNAKAISGYLGQYFSKPAADNGAVSACLAMANGESGFRALKHGIAKAREFEINA